MILLFLIHIALLEKLLHLKPTFAFAPFVTSSQVDVDSHRPSEVNLSSTNLHLNRNSRQYQVLNCHGSLRTPFVLMQQIVVAVQVVEEAGPQTCEAPLPLQQ